MCKALQEMLKDERNEGIRILIETCQELGVNREEIYEKVKTKFALSDEEAEGYLFKHWTV